MSQQQKRLRTSNRLTVSEIEVSDAKAHDEQAAETVEHVLPVSDERAGSIAVENPNCNNRRKSVEGMHVIEHNPGLTCQTRSYDRLHEDGYLSRDDGPPHPRCSNGWPPLGSNKPETKKPIRDDDNPSARLVNISQHLGITLGIRNQKKSLTRHHRRPFQREAPRSGTVHVHRRRTVEYQAPRRPHQVARQCVRATN